MVATKWFVDFLLILLLPLMLPPPTDDDNDDDDDPMTCHCVRNTSKGATKTLDTAPDDTPAIQLQ
jgi:hypothetical protein